MMLLKNGTETTLLSVLADFISGIREHFWFLQTSWSRPAWVHELYAINFFMQYEQFSANLLSITLGSNAGSCRTMDEPPFSGWSVWFGGHFPTCHFCVMLAVLLVLDNESLFIFITLLLSWARDFFQRHLSEEESHGLKSETDLLPLVPTWTLIIFDPYFIFRDLFTHVFNCNSMCLCNRKLFGAI